MEPGEKQGRCGSPPYLPRRKTGNRRLNQPCGDCAALIRPQRYAGSPAALYRLAERLMISPSTRSVPDAAQVDGLAADLLEIETSQPRLYRRSGRALASIRHPVQPWRQCRPDAAGYPYKAAQRGEVLRRRCRGTSDVGSAHGRSRALRQ